MFWPTSLLKLLIISLAIDKHACDSSTPSMTTSTVWSTTTSIDLAADLAVRCDTHENCTSRIFSLDTYCCHSSQVCCNWFQYTITYNSYSTKSSTPQSLPFKAPTILTILLILILIVCLLFVSYCFSILFCFCFKCGLFKRPRVILINSDSLPNTESGLTSADLIISPKHSTTSSASSTSSLTYSNRNRRHKHSSSTRSKRLIKSSSSRSRQSSTARAYSNPNSSRRNNHRQSSQSDLFVEYESNSPFLIPTQLVSSNNSQSSKRTNRSRNIVNHMDRVATSVVQPSAPLAVDDFHLNSVLQRTSDRLMSASSAESLGETVQLREDVVVIQEEETRLNENLDDLNQQALYLDEKPPSYDVAVAAYQSIEFYNNNNNQNSNNNHN